MYLGISYLTYWHCRCATTTSSLCLQRFRSTQVYSNGQNRRSRARLRHCRRRWLERNIVIVNIIIIIFSRLLEKMGRVAVLVRGMLKRAELKTMAMENLQQLSSTLSIHSGRKILNNGHEIYYNIFLISFGVDNPELMRLSNIALLRCFNNMVRPLFKTIILKSTISE